MTSSSTTKTLLMRKDYIKYQAKVKIVLFLKYYKLGNDQKNLFLTYYVVIN